MTDDVHPREMRRYLETIRRQLPMVVAITVVGVLLGSLYAITRPTAYAASTRVLLQPNDPAERLDPDVPAPNIPSPDEDRIVANQLQILQSDRVAGLAAQRLQRDGIQMSPTQVRHAVSAAQTGATNVIRVSATTKRAAAAAAVSNAVANTYIDDRRAAAVSSLTRTVQQLDTYGDQGNSLNSLNLTSTQVEALRARLLIDISLQRGGADIVDPARAGVLSRPSITKFGLLGGLLGFLVALGLVFAFDQFDDRVHTVDDVERLVNAPVLAVLPVAPTPRVPKNSLPVLEAGEGPLADAFRRLRGAIHLGNQKPSRRILVTGASHRGAHSLVAANLAFAHGQSGARTVLLEADVPGAVLRSVVEPALDADTQTTRGLGDVVESLVPNGPSRSAARSAETLPVPAYEEAVAPSQSALRRELAVRLVPTTAPMVYFLPFGKSSAVPADVLTMRDVTQVFAALATLFDVVISDAPAPQPGNESVALAQHSDLILLVAVLGTTTAHDLERWLASLGRRREDLAGVVVYGAKRGRRDHRNPR